MNYKDTPFARSVSRAFRAVILLFVVYLATTASALAQKLISGKVSFVDSKKPIAGAKVTTRGGNKVVGTFSRPDGTFSINVPDGVTKLLFEYVGMKKQEVAISGDAMTVEMKEDVLQLQELVVTGIGITQEKKQLTYAAQEIKTAELTSNRQVNAINALAGQVAGVQINSSSGSPGAATFIRIRGFSSITGRNQPLFVIDGVPIDNTVSANSGTNQGGVDVSNRALDINPDDIESVNVLKGAAATALYGIQAGPGAIIITTKKGKNDGIINVSYSFTKGFDQVNKLPELQNQFTQGVDGDIRDPESRSSLSWGPRADTLFWDGDKAYDWDGNGRIIGQTSARGNSNAKKFTPYQNLNFFTTGQTDIHTLNMSGGNALGKFYFGVTQSRNTGIVPNTSLDKTTLRLNADYKLGSDFSLGANVQYNRTGQIAVERGSNVGGIMLGLLRTPISFDNANSAVGVTNPGSDVRAASFAPTSSRYVNAAGAINQRTYRGSGIYDNPYWVVQRNLFNANTERVLGNTQLTFAPQTWFGKDILGDLNVTWRLGGDFYTTTSQQNTAINSVNNPAGAVLNVEERSQIINSDFLLTLSKDIDESTRYSLVIGNNAYQNYYRSYRTFATNLAIPEFYNISNAIDAPLLTERLNIYRLGAWYGKLDLSLLKEAININGTIRTDWSTTLPAAANPFISYSGAVSVILSDLLQLDQETLSFIKVRASYGRIGNDAGGLLYLAGTPVTRNETGFATIGDGWVNNGVTFPLNGVPSFRKTFFLGSGDNLRAESKTEIEAGLDLKFFQNRLSLDLAYFNNTVDDLIIPIQVATSSGYRNRNVNAATIRNNGIEAILGATIIQTEDFTLKATINWSRLETVVVKLAPGIPNFQLGGFTGNGIYAWEGKQYGQIVGQGFKRNAQGAVLIDDDGFPLLTDTIAPFGANIPDWQAGVRLAATYKGFSVSALLDIKQGGVMINGTRGALNNFGMSKESEDRGKSTFTTGGGLIKVVDNVFQGVVESTGQPNAKKVDNIGRNWWGNLGSYNVFNTNLAEAFVENAGWVRLRELTVSYAFPKDLVGSTGFLNGLELFATARNLWLSTPYSGVDPETNLENSGNAQGFEYFNNPGTRSYMFGIKVSF
ncbi:MAG: SusC/RagA family TonB-linked outer membrane protein [Candidatus Kapaibacteriota bacterium]